MRKIQLVALAFGAVCVLSALVSTSAFALTFALANWLEAGVPITVNKATETEGELLFQNLESGATFLCSGIFIGTVGANGADEVTKILNLALEEVVELHEEGATKGILCSSDGSICETGSEIWGLNLPYKSELMLDTEDSLFYDLILLNAAGHGPGYFILCLFLGASIDQLCEITLDEAYQNVSNAATDVEALGAIEPEAVCNPELPEVEQGLIENNSEHIALIKLVSGATLAASE